MSFPAPSTAVLDTFNRANGAPGANWIVNGGTGGIVSNQLAVTVPNDYSVDWATKFVGPCELYFDWTTVSVDGIDCWITTDVWAAGNGYTFVYRPLGTTRLSRIDAEVETQLGADVSVSFADGDGLGLRFTGAALELWQRVSGVWSLVDSRSDATYAGQTFSLGLHLNDGHDNAIDNFGGGTIRPVISSVTPSTFADGTTGIVIAGSNL